MHVFSFCRLADISLMVVQSQQQGVLLCMKNMGRWPPELGVLPPRQHTDNYC
jgi:hypothetical protein